MSKGKTPGRFARSVEDRHRQRQVAHERDLREADAARVRGLQDLAAPRFFEPVQLEVQERQGDRHDGRKGREEVRQREQFTEATPNSARQLTMRRATSGSSKLAS